MGFSGCDCRMETVSCRRRGPGYQPLALTWATDVGTLFEAGVMDQLERRLEAARLALVAVVSVMADDEPDPVNAGLRALAPSPKGLERPWRSLQRHALGGGFVRRRSRVGVAPLWRECDEPAGRALTVAQFGPGFARKWQPGPSQASGSHTR